MNMKKLERIARQARIDALNALQELVMQFLSEGRDLDEFGRDLRKILEYEMDLAADEKLTTWNSRTSADRTICLSSG